MGFLDEYAAHQDLIAASTPDARSAVVERFFNERVAVDTGARTGVRALYEEYVAFAKGMGAPYYLNASALSRWAGANGIKRERTREPYWDGPEVAYLLGVRLRTEDAVSRLVESRD